MAWRKELVLIPCGYQQQIVDIRYHRISTAKGRSTKGYIDSWCRSCVSLPKSGSETVQLSSYEDADHNVKG